MVIIISDSCRRWGVCITECLVDNSGVVGGVCFAMFCLLGVGVIVVVVYLRGHKQCHENEVMVRI